mgnify:CR=1 FL=1
MTASAVTRAEERSRYELRLDGDLAGFAEFRLDEGSITFVHTVIEKTFRGRGLGAELAGGALADAARRGERIVPRCPFMAAYLRDNHVPNASVDWPDGD